MITKEQRQAISEQEKNCNDAWHKFDLEMQKLSQIATKIYGKELVADMCEGGEIEFRVNGDNFSCLRIEDIINN